MIHYKYLVTYRKRTGPTGPLCKFTTVTHINREHIFDRTYRTMLLIEYNRTNKKVIKIEAVL